MQLDYSKLKPETLKRFKELATDRGKSKLTHFSYTPISRKWWQYGKLYDWFLPSDEQVAQELIRVMEEVEAKSYDRFGDYLAENKSLDRDIETYTIGEWMENHKKREAEKTWFQRHRDRLKNRVRSFLISIHPETLALKKASKMMLESVRKNEIFRNL